MPAGRLTSREQNAEQRMPRLSGASPDLASDPIVSYDAMLGGGASAQASSLTLITAPLWIARCDRCRVANCARCAGVLAHGEWYGAGVSSA